MKGKRFLTDQIINVLKEADAGLPIAELCRKYGISEATYYNWKAKYGGMTISDARRLKDLEQENGRLKKLVADQALDIQMLKEVCSKNFSSPK
jgi:putative transposase